MFDNDKINSIVKVYNIENNRSNLTYKEYYILLTLLLYSVDKIANIAGHF
jgi:adenine-specific DNA methylase